MINYDKFLELVVNTVNTKTPFCHVRYGDGEGIVAGYPEHVSRDKALQRWHKWIGKIPVSDECMLALSKRLKSLIKDVDILGLPCKRHMKMDSNWRNVVKHIPAKDAKHTCCMDWIVEMQYKGDFAKILTGQEKIYCVTCRNVENKLKKRYGIKEIETFYLKPQARPNMGDKHCLIPHYPDRFNQFFPWLEGLKLNGEIFLVGAGGLGKVYCHEIKKAGGIALDIGSVFDGWVGLGTRSHIRNNMRKFKI